MGWSWRLGRIAGIEVFVHATFLLLLGWVALSSWSQEQSLQGALEGVAFILAIFACVVLHEYGHALTARRYGIQTRDITLLPIGGVARLERMPEEPRQELLVALAGPAVNLVIAALLFAWLQATDAFDINEDMGLVTGSFAVRLLATNIWLALFNLIPAFPMDGGRVLRALLAYKMSYVRATQIAARVGQGMALLFGFAGLFTNPFLLFIALFVWIGAASEASSVEMRSAVRGVTVRAAMLTDFETLTPRDPLYHAVQMILRGSQQDFPVVAEDGKIAGLLTRPALLDGLARDGEYGLVGDAMCRELESVGADEPLDEAMPRLSSSECRTLGVMEHGTLIGLLTLENLGEFLMIRNALDRSGSRRGGLREPAMGVR